MVPATGAVSWVWRARWVALVWSWASCWALEAALALRSCKVRWVSATKDAFACSLSPRVGLGFNQPGALGGQVTFQFHPFARLVLGGMAGDEAFAYQLLEVCLAGLGHGHGGLQLGDGFPDGGNFCLAPCRFRVDRASRALMSCHSA